MKTTCRMCDKKFHNTVGSKMCNRCKIVSFTAAMEHGEDVCFVEVEGQMCYMTQVTGKILDITGVEA